MSADNVLGREIVLKISHLPSKLRFSAKCSFFGQSLSRGHYQPTYQPPEGVYSLSISQFSKLRALRKRFVRWRMVLQKLWVSQNFSRISRVSQSRFLAVMCVSQSRFLYEGVSESRFFPRLRNFREKVNPNFA